MSKKVLLTGAGGFIGSHCLRWWLKYTDWTIYCIDSFCHKGWMKRIDEVRAIFEARLAIDGLLNEFKGRVKIFTHDLSVPLDTPLTNQLLDKTIHCC